MHGRLLLPSKTAAGHAIIADSEAKPESRNLTSGRTEETDKSVQERPGPSDPGGRTMGTSINSEGTIL